MDEELVKIQTKLDELNTLMDSYVNKPGAAGELTGTDAVQNLQNYMHQTEDDIKALIEIFLTDQAKSEAATWSQQEKDDMAKKGLELFNKMENLDKLITPQSPEELDESAEPAPLVVSGRSVIASVMQLLCVIRGFTQLVNFFLIDATFAIAYIIKDKIYKVVHLTKATYSEARDAWRLRCA